MDADLDTLATALYVRTDDLLKTCPQRAPWRPATGITPEISDAELVTLAVLQALLGFVSEARWLRFAGKSLRGLFPYLPGQSGYNKRLRKLAALARTHAGATPLAVSILFPGEAEAIIGNTALKVAVSDELLAAVNKLFGAKVAELG